MKRLVAIMLAIFAVTMGTMFAWGFIDKQSKESSLSTTAQTTPSTTPGNTPGNSSQSPTQQNTSSSNSRTSSYTKSQLAAHNKPSDCWLGINGNAFDVTNYIDMHPGGADIVLMYCGKDATEAYNTKGGQGGGHSGRANAQLAQYKVGTLQ